MWQGLGEAAANVVFSVGLTWLLVMRGWGSDSVIGVAAGSVLPTVIFGWLLLWRWAAREVGTSAVGLFRETLLRPLLACLPMVVAGAGFRWLMGPSFGDPAWIPCLAGMAVTGAIGAAGVWIVALEPAERQGIAAKVRRRSPRAEFQREVLT